MCTILSGFISNIYLQIIAVVYFSSIAADFLLQLAWIFLAQKFGQYQCCYVNSNKGVFVIKLVGEEGGRVGGG